MSPDSKGLVNQYGTACQGAGIALAQASGAVESAAKVAAARAALAAHIEALERDAARYRWLADAPPKSLRWPRWRVECFDGPNGWQNMRFDALGDAIDAAIRAEKENSRGQ